MSPDKITVMQVFDWMGIIPTPAESWSVGAQVASMYATTFGEQPPKENRPKTGGGGTHCFAIYPRSWQSRIEGVIQAVAVQSTAQMAMFP